MSGPGARWGIAFTSLAGYRSWLAKSSMKGGPIRSTNVPDEVAVWEYRLDAMRWLSISPLEEGKPVAIGVGYLVVRVVEVPLTPDACPGTAFELPRFTEPEPTPAQGPEPEKPQRVAPSRAQATFAFTD
jgi:hypothetical protein